MLFLSCYMLLHIANFHIVKTIVYGFGGKCAWTCVTLILLSKALSLPYPITIRLQSPLSPLLLKNFLDDLFTRSFESHLAWSPSHLTSKLFQGNLPYENNIQSQNSKRDIIEVTMMANLFIVITEKLSNESLHEAH